MDIAVCCGLYRGGHIFALSIKITGYSSMTSIPRLTPKEAKQSLNRQLIGAIRALDVDRAIRHINAGADVSGTTALIIACRASLPEVALYILAMPDVNLNIKDGRGETPLSLPQQSVFQL